MLIETTNKSITVFEDIDCSLNLTGKCEKKKDKEEGGDDDGNPFKKEADDGGSRVAGDALRPARQDHGRRRCHWVVPGKPGQALQKAKEEALQKAKEEALQKAKEEERQY